MDKAILLYKPSGDSSLRSLPKKSNYETQKREGLATVQVRKKTKLLRFHFGW